MKQLLAFLALVIPLHLFADCGSGGISIFPRGREISKNPVFMVEGYAVSTGILLADSTRYYLVSGGRSYPLEIISSHKSSYHLAQVILRPKSTLNMNEAYTFSVRSASGRDLSAAFKVMDPDAGVFGEKFWVVTREEDKEKPQWTEAPEYIDSQYVPFGCGPAENAHFDLKLKDESGMMIRAELRTGEGEPEIYHLLYRGQDLFVGHGMCSGAFDLEEGKNYQVRFTPVDFSGNEGETSAWYEFRAAGP